MAATAAGCSSQACLRNAVLYTDAFERMKSSVKCRYENQSQLYATLCVLYTKDTTFP